MPLELSDREGVAGDVEGLGDVLLRVSPYVDIVNKVWTMSTLLGDAANANRADKGFWDLASNRPWNQDVLDGGRLTRGFHCPR